MSTKTFFFDPTELIGDEDTERDNCSHCSLRRGCTSPKMEPDGGDKLGIMVVGEAPGADEDEEGVPFVGRSGRVLRKAFKDAGINMGRDCIATNIVQCRPPGNRTPTPQEVERCRPRLERQIREADPDIIFAFGSLAINALLNDAPTGLSSTKMHGRCVPSHRLNAWVCCSMHPSWFQRKGKSYDPFLVRAIQGGLEKLEEGKLKDRRLDPSAYEMIEDISRAEELLVGLSESDNPVDFDYETSCLSPYSPNAKFLLVGFSTDPGFGYAIPLEHPWADWRPEELDRIYKALKRFLSSDAPKVIQNRQFEEIWSQELLDVAINNVVGDTKLREHVLDNRMGVNNQEFQEFVRYGETGHKSSVSRAALDKAPLDKVACYCALDCRYGLQWYRDQEKELSEDIRPGVDLLERSTPLCVKMKRRGIDLDMSILDELENDIKDRTKRIQDACNAPFVQTYKRKYHKSWDSGSNRAKQRLFYGVLGLEPLKLTPKGKDLDNPEHCAVDAESMEYLLKQVKEDSAEAVLIRACVEEQHLTKLNGYIQNFRAQADADGRLHPSFLLHVASSYRSSSADPNFQNIPVRNELMARLRKAMVPRNDWLLEMDFSGNEVRGYAVLSRDPRLIYNIKNGVDYHRDYAALLYEKAAEAITKQERYKGKNGFVFPEFYGDYYASIAAKNPEWSEERVKQAEEQLWTDLSKLREWQRETEKEYLRTGYIKVPSGFRIAFGKEGPLSFNQICNMPNQGFSFHRVLHVLNAIEAKLTGMKSILLAQVHDSGVFDVTDDELSSIITIAEEVAATPVWGFDDVVPWDVEFKLGPNMMEMEEI